MPTIPLKGIFVSIVKSLDYSSIRVEPSNVVVVLKFFVFCFFSGFFLLKSTEILDDL